MPTLSRSKWTKMLVKICFHQTLLKPDGELLGV
jgi:hypothetical protein